MEKKNIKLTPETSAHWLAATGYIFPNNPEELELFNMFMGELDPDIDANVVDPKKIIQRSKRGKKAVVRKLPKHQDLLVAKKADHASSSKKKNQKKKGGK